MALLATDEPLDGSHLIVLYSVQSEYGTVASTCRGLSFVLTSPATFLKKLFGRHKHGPCSSRAASLRWSSILRSKPFRTRRSG